jgi:hypothetical protein
MLLENIFIVDAFVYIPELGTFKEEEEFMPTLDPVRTQSTNFTVL